MAQSLHDAFLETLARSPGRPFLAESALAGGRCWTYREVGAEVARLAALYGAAGWGAGHRVALGVGNHPRHFFHLLALNGLGASVVPLNPDHRGAEIRYTLAHAGVQLAVGDAGRAAALREAAAGEPALAALPVVAVESLEAAGAALPPAPAAAAPQSAPLQREAAILYTSGTSGRPKGCVLNNGYMLGAGAWYAGLGGLLSLHRGSDRLLNPLPVFHMNCMVVAFSAVCQTDNCLVLPERFHATRWWEDCVRSGATAIHYLGIMPPALFKQPVDEWESRHRIRFGLGAGCDPTLHGAFEARFGFPLVEVWGMTETGRFIPNHVEPRQVHTRAFGRERAPLQARVADDTGAELPAGAVGELLVRATGDDPRQGFFSGYLHDEEATAQAWRGGWFHTGDMVQRDTDGLLHFVDRRKDMVRRSGENISSAEVEAVLAAHPAVLRVAVLAVPDEMRDEEVMAVVVPAPGAEASAAAAQALARHCLTELAYYKAPGWLVFRDGLPTTATNKVQKNRLFAPDEDPRAGAHDLRALKKRGAAPPPPGGV